MRELTGQNYYVCMHVEKYNKVYYNVEVITHDDGRHYFYLNGVNTFCFIERNVSEHYIWKLKDSFEVLTNFPHSIGMGLSKYNNNILTGIIHRYTAEHFI